MRNLFLLMICSLPVLLSANESQTFSQSPKVFGVTAKKFLCPDPSIKATCELFDDSQPIRLTVRSEDFLYLHYAINPAANEALLRQGGQAVVRVKRQDGSFQKIWEKTITPKKKTDQGWQFKQISLKEFEGEVVEITLDSEIPNSGIQTSRFYEKPILWGGVRVGEFSRKENELNIIIISLDTTRADRLGIYGGPRNTSPNLDALAKQGVYFVDALTQSPWTKPSHMSIMTGLYPSQHGMLHTRKSGMDKQLSTVIPTLAELLQKQGYLTHAMTGSGYVAADWGFYRGFDYYGETFRRTSTDIKLILGEGWKWVKENRDKKFFLFLHSYEMHSPYLGQHFRKDLDDKASKRDKLLALYDGDIYNVDNELGKFFSRLKSLSLDKNTLIVVLGDHGEDLNDRHFGYRHGHSLYEELLRVPLIFSAPGQLSPRKIDNFQACLIDVFPTVLASVNRPLNDLSFSGKNLWPILQGAPVEYPQIAISEGVGAGPPRIAVRYIDHGDKFKLILTPIYQNWPSLPWEFQKKRGFDRRAKVLVGYLKKAKGIEFFNLKIDPKEANFAQRNPQKIFDVLFKRAKDFVLQLPMGQSGSDLKLDSDIQETLKALGY